MKRPVCTVTIGATCLPTMIQDPGSAPDDIFQYIDISSIDRDKKHISQVESLRGADAPSRARKLVATDDVLVSTVRPNLNAVAMVGGHLDGAIASTGFSVLRANRNLVEPRYLFFYCRTPQFIESLIKKVKGAHYPAVSDSDVRSTALPVPSLSEQRRVIELLDQANAILRLRTESDAKAERILPALFFKTFGNPEKNPKDWPMMPLGELTCHLTSGSRGWSGLVGRGEGAFLRTQDVIDGEIQNNLLSVDAPDGAEAERTRLRPGDVVVTITGMVGKAAVFRGYPRPVYVSQHVAIVRPVFEQLDPDFLAAFANLPVGDVPALARFQYGQTKPGLGFRELKMARIPVPPISTQREFAMRVHACRVSRDARTRARGTIYGLWSAVLSRAFSGDLTSSWRIAHMKELFQEMEQQARYLDPSATQETGS